MSELFSDFLDTSEYLFPWMLGFMLVFPVLEKLMPCNPQQPLLQKACITDFAYLYIMPMFSRFISDGYMSVGIYFMFRGKSDIEISDYLDSGFGPAATLPLWGQAALVFLISDFILYWTHRWFHGKELWRFHAIHHGPTQIEWHTNYRFHPVNVWLSFTLVDTLMIFSGFSLESVTLFNGFNMIYSAMVHANLNWTFGPFKYVFASPVFHRWHHTTQDEALNKNFAPTFPLLDIVFGTFYMPEGKLPEHYGIIGGTVPESFLGQLIYPFRKKNK